MSDMHHTHGGGSELPPENLPGDRTTYLPAGHALPGGPEAPLAGPVSTGTGAGVTAGRVDSDHLLPAHAGPGEPGQIAATDDPDVARAEIEATRARMSETIDSIENALLRKKGEIQERMDVTAPVRQKVREQPLLIAGGVFAAGLVLGYLTGGNDDESEDVDVREILRAVAAGNAGGAAVSSGIEIDRNDGEWRGRARDWERQARRLMKENRQYEEELRSLRAQLGERSYEGRATYVVELDDAETSRGGWRDAVSGALAGLFRRSARQELDVEFHPDAALERELDDDDGWDGYQGGQAGMGDGSPGLQGYGEGYGYDHDRYPDNQLPG